MRLKLNVNSEFLYNFYMKDLWTEEEFKTMLSQMYVNVHVKCLLPLSDFNRTLNWSADFSKNPQYKILPKAVHWK
jgi:hypothetical protein